MILLYYNHYELIFYVKILSFHFKEEISNTLKNE